MPFAGKEGIKQGGDWFADDGNPYIGRLSWSTSPARKRAQAEIAKIPFLLANWIAKAYNTAMSTIDAEATDATDHRR